MNRGNDGFRPDRKSNKDCYKCGVVGHLAFECPNKDADGPGMKYKGGGRGRGGPGLDRGGPKTCHYCNESGHFIRECPKRDRNDRDRDDGPGYKRMRMNDDAGSNLGQQDFDKSNWQKNEHPGVGNWGNDDKGETAGGNGWGNDQQMDDGLGDKNKPTPGGRWGEGSGDPGFQ